MLDFRAAEAMLTENRSARERTEREQKEQSMKGSAFITEVGDVCIRSVELDATPKVNSEHPAIAQRARSSQFERAQSVAKTEQLAPHGMTILEHPFAETLPSSTMNPPQEDIPSPPKSSRIKTSIPSGSSLASTAIPGTSSSQLLILPSIFAPFPRHLDTLDLAYLNSRDALTLPSEPLQIALLKAYIEFVHPTFPILDLEDFLSVVKYGFKGLEGEKGKGLERESARKIQVPFLLFQAIMFAGVEFVSMGALKAAGYKTRDSAKKTFFARIRVRYSPKSNLEFN
jgi:hypothetical protein